MSQFRIIIDRYIDVSLSFSRVCVCVCVCVCQEAELCCDVLPFKKYTFLEFPSWLSGNESDQHPWGRRFDPWPRSVGQGSSVSMSCGVGHRCGSDLALLWLWRRPKTTVPIRPLAWELPDAMGVALEKQKTNIYIYTYVHKCRAYLWKDSEK